MRHSPDVAHGDAQAYRVLMKAVSHQISRRSVLATLSTAAMPVWRSAMADDSPRYRAAAFGWHKRGNFGHGMELVFQSVDEIELAAISDPVEAGRAASLARLEKAGQPAPKVYSEYEKLLKREKPDFVSIGPRFVAPHREMCLAAISAGVKGLYVEKPFLLSPAECDEVLSAAEAKGTKIAVAHRNAYHPSLEPLCHFLLEGGIGKIHSVQGRGKGDGRGGMVDAWVLGTHVFDLMERLTGGLESVTATIMKNGATFRPSSRDDLIESREEHGLVGGDGVEARFTTGHGWAATFSTMANDEAGNETFGMRIFGSEGEVNLRCDQQCLAWVKLGNPYDVKNGETWRPFNPQGLGVPVTADDQLAITQSMSHETGIRDLMRAVEEPMHEPVCSGADAARTIEVLAGIVQSHRDGGVLKTLPLTDRSLDMGQLSLDFLANPLARA